MRKLLVVLVLLLVAVPGFAAKSKDKDKFKTRKSKSFEARIAAPAEYAGTYRGPSEHHTIQLQMSGGSLRGVYRELGRVAKLSPLAIDGADFTAVALFDDGTRRDLTGSFAVRILNGERAPGLRLQDVHVEGHGPVDTFFVLTSPPSLQ
jgi:hypothetical protein